MPNIFEEEANKKNDKNREFMDAFYANGPYSMALAIYHDGRGGPAMVTLYPDGTWKLEGTA